MAREQNKTKLSKSILEMKFMKRTKEKVEKELEDNEGQEMYSHEITAEMRQGAGCFTIEPSFVRCEELLEGRLSYGGMNPEIERIMELENADANRLAQMQTETEISDLEMASHYNPLVKTMNSKFIKRSHDQMETSAPNTHRKKYEKSFSSNMKPNANKRKWQENNQHMNSPTQHKNKKSKFLKPVAE